VFDQAWSMMAEAEQNVFMKTAVFRGGFTRDAGQSVIMQPLRKIWNELRLLQPTLFDKLVPEIRSFSCL
jgi:hypothetical protein